MRLAGSCHCGAISLELPRRPRSLTACNCSICRRYGVLWAYFRADRVRIAHRPRTTAEYRWGRRRLRFVRCARCGCVAYWQRVGKGAIDLMGVNARLFEPADLAGVPIRRLDGARTWKYLD